MMPTSAPAKDVPHELEGDRRQLETVQRACQAAVGQALRGRPAEERIMSIATILLFALILMLFGVFPLWKYASSWGYGPSGVVGVGLIAICVLFLMGRP
jgi:hypothetical protein